jgi:hypothetical protein
MTAGATGVDQVRGSVDPSSLRVFNAGMALLHAAQGIAILLLSTGFALPVTTAYLKFDEASESLATDPNTLFELELAPLVALFLFISAFAHGALSLPGIFGWYIANLGRGINYGRWCEYSLSASVMIVVIALLVGVYDLSSLILIFTVNAGMIFFGLAMEIQNQGRERVDWTPFVLGCILGTVPWVVISLYLLAPTSRSVSDVPTFVYGIYVSLFIFFNVFAVNMFLQYKKIGPWRDYLFGERAYILLSLTAKSALAWQVFAGTLRDV